MKRIFLIFFSIIVSGVLFACAPTYSHASSTTIVQKISKTDEKNVYHLNIEQQYLNYIINGEKISEGRLNVPDFSAMKKGDLVYFTDGNGGKAICSITSVGRYDSFNKMLVSEGVINMLPEIDPNTNSSEEMLLKGDEIYRSFPGYKEGVKIYGAIAFGLYYITDETVADIDVINVNDA